MQHKNYMILDKKEDMFYNANDKKGLFKGAYHDCSGAEWCFELDWPHDEALRNLKAFTIWFLTQKGQGSATERHVQSKKRGSCSLSLWKSSAYFE